MYLIKYFDKGISDLKTRLDYLYHHARCCEVWTFSHGDMNNPDAFLDQRCHYAYTPMPKRVEKGEQTGMKAGFFSENFSVFPLQISKIL